MRTPDLWARLVALVRPLLFRRRVERELAEEVDFHLTMEAEKGIRAGEDAARARRAARMRFGGVDRYLEHARDGMGLSFVSGLGMDVRTAVRLLHRRPAITAGVVLTLAVGLGATAGMLPLAWRGVSPDMPFADPDRVLHIVQRAAGSADPIRFSLAEVRAYGTATSAFAETAGYDDAFATLRGVDGLVRVEGAEVTAAFFDVMGLDAALGRVLGVEDDRPGAAPTVVLSDEFFRTRFGGDAGAIGGTLELSGVRYDVAGVMAPGFAFPSGARFWIAAGPLEEHSDPRNRDLAMVGRLVEGSTMDQARAETPAIGAALDAMVPGRGLSLDLEPAKYLFLTRETERASRVLVGALLLLAVLTLGNAAQLAGARTAARSPELRVRERLGAGRPRLRRQLAVEGISLAVPGILAAVPTAQVTTAALVASGAPAGEGAGVWPLVSGALLACCALVGASLLAARFAGRAPDHGERVIATDRVARIAVAFQVGVAFVLLVGAALFTETLRKRVAVEPGFRADGVLAMSYSMPDPWFALRDERRAVHRRVVERLRTLPGVEAAGATLRMPVVGTRIEFAVAGEGTSPEPPPVAVFSAVTPDFFGTFGIPLLEGRDIGPDDDGGNPVAVVSTSLARRLWPAETSPVGRRLRIGESRSAIDPATPLITVVGVVGDIRHDGHLGAADLAVYVPYDQFPAWYATVMVRHDAGATLHEGALRAALLDVHPQLLLTRRSAVSDLLRDSVSRERLLARLFSLFGLVATALAGIGAFGLVLFLVRRRTREIGVRIALGEPPIRTIGSVVAWGLRWSLIGIGAGALSVIALRPAVAGLLFGVSPLEPGILAGCAAALLVLTVAAAVGPAARAARIGPLRALRSD